LASRLMLRKKRERKKERKKEGQVEMEIVVHKINVKANASKEADLLLKRIKIHVKSILTRYLGRLPV
jgi:hypothetical protein